MLIWIDWFSGNPQESYYLSFPSFKIIVHRPIFLANFICLSTGERQGQEVGVGGLVSRGRGHGIGGFGGETRKGDNI